MIEEPLVTVNILSFNRKDELRNTLNQVYEQDYKNIEVIVVDNASSDGSAEMVKSEFPQVQLIQLEKNIGIAGWNEGFKAAKGEFILVLDDDSYPLSGSIINGIEKFYSSSNLGIVAFKVFDLNMNETDSIYLQENNLLYFIGCAALIKKSIFYEVGFFSKILFIYEHEIDFTIRVINSGYSIILINQSRIIHTRNKLNRKLRNNYDDRRIYYRTRNILIILTKYFPLKIVGLRIIRIIIGRLWFGLKNQCFLIISKAILDYLFLLSRIMLDKTIITKQTIIYYDNGKFAGGFFFIDDSGGNRRPKWLSR
jgi:hypothetical protein